MEKNELTRFGVAMPQGLVEDFDQWCNVVGYANRSEAIRDLVRKAILAPEQLKANQLVAGTIVMVYDHHANDLSAKLTELQHDFHHDIVSTMHIHLNHNQCLEIIVVRGRLQSLRELSHQIQVLKGVLFAELSVTHIETDDHHLHAHDHVHHHQGALMAHAAGNHSANVHSDDGQTDEAGPIPAFDTLRAEVFDGMAAAWEEISKQADAGRIALLLEQAQVKGKTVLDVGTGTGVLVGAGLAAQAKKWIACDLSTQMLAYVRDKHPDESRLELLQADVHALPLEAEAVDLIICHQVFPHFHSPERALAEMYRVLKPGGVLIINHFAGKETINHIHRSALLLS